MLWWKRQVQANTDDVAEARALREEAKAKRRELTEAGEPGIVSAIVHRRTLDGFGEELQITFTRRTPQ